MPRPATLKELIFGWWPSDLPINMEAKRRAIAKVHNFAVIGYLLALTLAGFLWFSFLGFVGLPKNEGTRIAILIAPIALAATGFFFFIIRLDRWLCKKCDFDCPHCKKPLYFDPRMTHQYLLQGLCPRCKKKIEAETLTMASSETLDR